MRKNTVKEALAEGKVQLGTGFGQLRSPEIPRILAAAGFHWAFIDTEHGGFDLETVQDICRVSLMAGLSPDRAGGRPAIFADRAGSRLRRAGRDFSARGIAGVAGAGHLLDEVSSPRNPRLRLEPP